MSPQLHLDESEIHLWVCCPHKIDNQDLLSAYRVLLNDEEKARRGKFLFGRHQHQYLITRALVRTALSHYADIPPAAWRFSRNPFGKPKIAAAMDLPDLNFNLSHTDGMIICGVTRGADLGVDVEDSTRQVEAAEITERYFSPREARDLAEAPEDRKTAVFFDYWTLKEAYIKARGMGLSIPLDECSFRLGPPEGGQIVFESRRRGDTANWKFLTLQQQEKYKIAVAVRGCPNRVHRLSMMESIPLSTRHPISIPITRSSGGFSRATRPRPGAASFPEGDAGAGPQGSCHSVEGLRRSDASTMMIPIKGVSRREQKK